MPDPTYQPKVYKTDGGDTLVIAAGGKINVEPGGDIQFDGVDVVSGSDDGLQLMKVARAPYDFAEHGGAIGAIGSGVTLPDGAIICGGFVDVVTTCQTAGADAGTMAIHVEGANDIVAAIAVNAANPGPWDQGLQAIIPKATTPETTGIKLTADREITFTIAGQAFTAGKFTVFLYFLQGD